MENTMLLQISWQDLYNLIIDLPIGYQAIIVIIMLFIKLILILGVKNVVSIIKTFIKSSKNKYVKISRKDLYNHSLFFTKNYIINHKIKMMNFGDDKRTYIFRDLLEIKINCICDNAKKLIDIPNVNKVNKTDFKSFAFQNFSDIVDNYNIKFKSIYGKDIYDLIMQDKDKGFNRWQETVIIYTRELIEDICESDAIGNNVEKIFSILNTYHSAIDATLVNVEKTFNMYNGELDKLFIKNDI